MISFGKITEHYESPNGDSVLREKSYSHGKLRRVADTVQESINVENDMDVGTVVMQSLRSISPADAKIEFTIELDPQSGTARRVVRSYIKDISRPK